MEKIAHDIFAVPTNVYAVKFKLAHTDVVIVVDEADLVLAVPGHLHQCLGVCAGLVVIAQHLDGIAISGQCSLLTSLIFHPL